jgi:diguanylate cyclase (GGDEF)-like protein
MEQFLRTTTRFIEQLDKRVLLLGCLAIVLVLGYLDHLTGYEFSFSIFYLLPIFLAAWFCNRNYALLVSVVSAITWLLSNKLAGASYSHPIIGYWNAFMIFGFFSIVSLLLVFLRRSLEHERNLSRIDFITGITNSRAFYELAATELLRAKRYNRPFSVAYLDVDNFKQINDRLGHNTGDTLLKVVAETLRTQLRQTDIVARMGGDEFILFLPETDGESAIAALSKSQVSLLSAMEQNKWEVTFSIGAKTFYNFPLNVNEMIRQVDELMYTVKANGKSSIRFAKE